MREIKFRAWDGAKMWNWEDIIKDKEILCSVMRNEFYACIPPKYFWQRQQYTGLKDKNGVEIYEGDIIEHNSRALKKPIRQTIEFEYLEGGDDADMDSYGYHVNPYWNNDFEVVGNIFEGVKE